MSGRSASEVRNPEQKRVAIYTRKSTSIGLEKEFNSLDAQRAACEASARGRADWKILEERYDDGGFTGANLDRPAFCKLLADIEAGKIDVVVVYKVDRLSRSLLDFAKVMERFKNAGCAFVSVTQNFSTADAMGRLTLNMLMSFAEFEREMIAERVRDKIAASRRRGKWTGGAIPIGYDVKDKRLVINDAEALVVREAFTLFLEHRLLSRVAETLNDRGRLLKSTASKPRLRRWDIMAVKRVLSNPIYIGQVSYGDERHAGEHLPIIDRTVFERAQVLLAERALTKSRYGCNPDYILRGLAYCAKCGTKMCTGSTRKAEREYRYYRCQVRLNKGASSCPTKQISAPALESYVVEQICAAFADPAMVADAERAFRDQLSLRRAELDVESSQLPRTIAAASAALTKLIDTVTSAPSEQRERFEAKLTEAMNVVEAAERRQAEVEAALRDLSAREVESEWVRRTMSNFSEVWGVLTSENRARLLHAVVNKIVVDEASGRVQVHLAEFLKWTAKREVAA